jgi:pimeloyl-ACP methyl ester carboxylesterase
MILHSAVFAAAMLALLYAGLAAGALLLADRIIFPAPPPSYADGDGIIKLRAADGTPLSAAHLPAPGARATLLFSHGNGEDLGYIRPLLEQFRRRGISVFAYDYPGYGTSGGRATEAGVFAAAEAAYRHLTGELGLPPEQIVLYGRSVGSGPSFWLAERFPVAGLVTEGAFASAFRVVPGARILPGDRFDNLSRLPRLRIPLLLVHGTRDRIVPFAHARLLKRTAPEQTRFLWVDGAGHNNLIEFAGTAYWDAVTAFVREVTPP